MSQHGRPLEEIRYEQRYARAVKRLTPGDVIAEIEAHLAPLTHSRAHPLTDVIQTYLDAGGPDVGRRPWNLDAMANDFDQLVQAALRRLIAAALEEEP